LTLLRVEYFLDINKKHCHYELLNISHFNNKMTDNLHESAEDYGTFNLTTTLIKRVRELMDGAPALIDTDSSDPIETSFEEFASGKISITDDVVTKE
jgi:DNA-directed RNA polymerase subunit K/omega